MPVKWTKTTAAAGKPKADKPKAGKQKAGARKEAR